MIASVRRLIGESLGGALSDRDTWVAHYPNPFDLTTSTRHALPPGVGGYPVYVITHGPETVILVNRKYEAGYYETTLNASDLASAV